MEGVPVREPVWEAVTEAVTLLHTRPPAGARLPSPQRHVNTGTPASAEGPNDSQSDGVKYWKGRIE